MWTQLRFIERNKKSKGIGVILSWLYYSFSRERKIQIVLADLVTESIFGELSPIVSRDNEDQWNVLLLWAVDYIVIMSSFYYGIPKYKKI